MGESEETIKNVMRWKPHVHRAIKAAATLAGVSFNTLVNDTMEAAYGPKNYVPGTSPGDVLNNSRSLYASTLASNSLIPTSPVPQNIQAAISALAGETPPPEESP